MDHKIERAFAGQRSPAGRIPTEQYPSLKALFCNARLFSPLRCSQAQGMVLVHMGEHQLTIRDYLRHSNLNVTNQYLQATSKTKRLAQEKLVDAILPTGSLSQSRSTLIQ
jgi:hypothetical protein